MSRDHVCLGEGCQRCVAGLLRRDAYWRDRSAQEARDRVIATAQVAADKHQAEGRGGGCTCGFCAWSVEHVLVMSMREALDGVGLVVSTAKPS